MGANVIQTFCIPNNGYAWYKNGIDGFMVDWLWMPKRICHLFVTYQESCVSPGGMLILWERGL
jgi:hypothetical protein